jgi:hypothetical protein
MTSDAGPAWWPEPRDGQARLTLLGSPHLHAPGNDAHGMELDDPLSTERQAQLHAVCERLEVRPFDHVAVEVPWGMQATLDEQYAAVRDGVALDDETAFPDGPVPVRSETVQIGFRVADALDLDGVVAVDSRPDPPEVDATWTVDEDPDEVPYPLLDAEELVQSAERRLRESTYLEALREQNRPTELRRNQQLNVAAAHTSGDEGDYTTATQLGYWYERNARMFENLARTTGPDEETLFVVGASHVVPVKQLAQAAPATCPRSARPLLTA